MSVKTDDGKTPHVVCDGKLYGKRPLKPITGITPSDAQQQPQNNSAEAKESKGK